MARWMGTAALTALAVGLVGCAQEEGGTPAADTIEATSPASLTIPYEKFTLDNGLEVVLHQDRSDPVLAINIAAHVGSSREVPGRTGFAHLFEHLLFLDSENLGYGGLDALNTRIGGTTVNGFTSNDMTQYYQNAPADALEKIIWAEAEKIGFFIKTVSADVLANEKQVVKNEKRQGVDNQPYGHIRPLLAKTLYPSDHPYSWPVIGSLEDLDAATLDDVKTFYNQWYVPNNVTLTIAGDFEIDEAKAYVEKYFGDIPRGPDITPLEPRAAELDADISLYHEDQFAQLPLLFMAWPSVEQYHPDSYALDILTTYLTEGKEAPLNEVLIDEEQLTSSVSMGNGSSEMAGTVTLSMAAKAGGDLNAMMPALEAGFARFEEEGIGDDDLERIKAGLEVSFYNNLQSVVGKAIGLAEYNTFTDNPGFVSEDIKRTLAVTTDDIMRVYATYIKDQPRVLFSFVPIGETDLVLSGATKADIQEETIVAGEGAPVDFDPTVRTFEPTPSAFDRSVEPPYGEGYTLPTPQVWTASLSNGLEVYGIESEETPLINFSLRLDAGRVRGSVDKPAVAAMTADMLTRGTANKTVAELEEALQLLGASVSVSAGTSFTNVSGQTLARNFDATIALVEEILLEPRWDETEFDLLKQSVAQSLDLAKGNPNAVASRLTNELAYDADHVLHYQRYGTAEKLAAVSLDDLKAFYTANYQPGGGALRVAGAVDEKSVVRAMASLAGRWQGEAGAKTDWPDAKAIEQSAVYFYDVPGAKQSVLRVLRPSVAATDENYALLNSVNFYLGGGFTSELNNELRVNKGYTYGARSGFSGGADRGRFSVSTSVRTNVTLESLELIRDILEGYGSNFDEARLDEMKQALLRQQALQNETLGSKLGILGDISTYGYPLDYQARNADALKALDLEQLRSLTDAYIRPDAMNYVVVGDAATQADRLDALGFGEAVMLQPLP